MPAPNPPDEASVLGRVLKACLREGHSVELDGLGVFVAGGREADHFVPSTAARVFIAYAIEDLKLATKLYEDLLAGGANPWLDRKKLLPGQQWSRCIERAIENSDMFVACFSRTSVVKKGQFPYEIRYALRWADRMPLDDLFILPIRFDDCTVPRVIASQTQYVDLFQDWDAGVARLVSSIDAELHSRRSRRGAA